MEKFKEILLDVWREACRNIEITESLPKIAKLLQQHIPLQHIYIRQMDETGLQFETVAFAPVQSALTQVKKTVTVSKESSAALSSWHHAGQISRMQELHEARLAQLFEKIDGNYEIIVGPLNGSSHLCPVLVFVSKSGNLFQSQHLTMMTMLLEPFSLALENDQRLREMVKLKEAAEADKKTLLAKLSRKEIGDTIVGEHQGLRKVMERIALVAHSDVPVLLFGETGTGKELIARAIHTRSNRKDGPFIRVNCGAIPRELIDSQLFGHERGAFTGAVESRKGWFERADGGTLFLDEIGEMPLDAQVRLLRILQDGWMERVGGKQPIRVDVRIVLATHRDLAAMVADGRFRDDLWYRLSTFPVFLPPLRERIDDLPLLANHFSERSAIRFGLPVCLPNEHDIELLASYDWPGNIRELGAVIDRAALLGNGRQLEIAAALGWSDSYAQPAQPQSGESFALPEQQIVPLDAVIKKHIEYALAHTHGRIEGRKGAAELLEINPHTLRARMRKLHIDWARFRENNNA
ncbi:sigma-54-dependent Fis family transcriptional regulator [candidate division KSB1 bacterium]|nr:sigma-54-dependent Fis family transcriptional regulator [candidate division KSB1 bacterium]